MKGIRKASFATGGCPNLIVIIIRDIKTTHDICFNRSLLLKIWQKKILDVKVRNYIDEKCVRQVLAYHYLSTKRSDLKSKRVIVYDATSDKAVTIDVSHKCSQL